MIELENVIELENMEYGIAGREEYSTVYERVELGGERCRSVKPGSMHKIRIR